MRRPETMLIPIPNLTTGARPFGGNRTVGGVLFRSKAKILAGRLSFHKPGTTSNMKLRVSVYNNNSTVLTTLLGTTGARLTSTFFLRRTMTLTAAKAEFSTTQRLNVAVTGTDSAYSNTNAMLALEVML
jgi:hypothetical protein